MRNISSLRVLHSESCALRSMQDSGNIAEPYPRHTRKWSESRTALFIHLHSLLNKMSPTSGPWNRRPSGSEKLIVLHHFSFLSPHFLRLMFLDARVSHCCQITGLCWLTRGQGSACFHESWKTRCNGKSTGRCF